MPVYYWVVSPRHSYIEVSCPRGCPIVCERAFIADNLTRIRRSDEQAQAGTRSTYFKLMEDTTHDSGTSMPEASSSRMPTSSIQSYSAPRNPGHANDSASASPVDTTANQPALQALTATVASSAVPTGNGTPIPRIVTDKGTTSGRTSYSCAECKRLKLKCSR